MAARVVYCTNLESVIHMDNIHLNYIRDYKPLGTVQYTSSASGPCSLRTLALKETSCS